MNYKKILGLASTMLLGSAMWAQNVGIGTATPLDKLHVIGNVRVSALAGASTRVVGADVNGTLQIVSAGANGQVLTQTAGGPAWQSLTDWSLLGNGGTNPASNFAGTTDAVDYVIRTNNVEKLRVQSGGNVGIGTASPGYRLDLASGTFAFGNSNTRTETRDNAGLQGNAGAQSGFFETSTPTNYPAGASSWWHLIDTRHSNNGNNYALQIAGSFFDQDLYYRKTNSLANTPWSRFLTTSNNLGWMTTGNAGTNAASNFVGTTDGVDFVTRTNNTERMRVMTGGAVGINTSAPVSRLHVAGDVRVGGISPINSGTYPGYGDRLYFSGSVAGPSFDSDNSDPIWMARYNVASDQTELRLNLSDNCQTADAFVIQTGGSGCGLTDFFRFDGSGAAYKVGGGSWSTFSDRRLKQNVNAFQDGLAVLRQIRPVNFQYNGMGGTPDNGKVYTGVIAQELQTIAPYMVDASQDYLRVDPSAFTYILINAVQEQQKQIDALKAEVAALKAGGQ